MYHLQQNLPRAEELLQAALNQSRQLDPPAPLLIAACANHLGNVLAQAQQPDKARRLYRDALDVLDTAAPADAPAALPSRSVPALKGSIYRNLAHLADHRDAAFDLLLMAATQAGRIPAAHIQVRLLLDIAAEAEHWDATPSGDAFRWQVLQRALTLAEQADPPHPRLHSLAAGNMGHLYESRDRMDDALLLTETALTAAAAINSHDLLLQWEWQLGRLLKATGEPEKAIAAFQRALFHADAIRQDLTFEDTQTGAPSLRTSLIPIYTGLADLLLAQAAQEPHPATRQEVLRAALQAAESSRQSELRDYFRDPCIDARTRAVQELSPTTAAIYPVILPDRLAVLADIGGHLYLHTVPIAQTALEQAASQLADSLRHRHPYERLAAELHTWLIAPFEDHLARYSTDTLIFVPDGVLRLVPLAALWNGQQFLAERYAVVTQPGLTLFDPQPLPRGQVNALMAGMSEPGPVIQHLPPSLMASLSQISLGQFDLALRGISIQALDLKTASLAAHPARPQLSTPAQREHIRELLRLPGVDQEMNHVAGRLPGDLLMNEHFLLNTFSERLQDQDFRVIHIASHGFFGGSSEDNFIMTYDQLLTLDQMEALIRPKQFVSLPVELIALSACQTAEGDDRSPLGLSGVALKSGARSVLGSLWPVSDLATQKLFTDFYDHLQQETLSKAQALQHAQIALLQDPAHRHPFYWAAFVMVGNWL